MEIHIKLLTIILHISCRKFMAFFLAINHKIICFRAINPKSKKGKKQKLRKNLA